MFGYKRKIQKELNAIWQGLYTHKDRLDKSFLERKSLETQIEILKDEIKQIEINYGDTIHNHSVFKEKIEKAIPTFNRNNEKIKKLEQNVNKIFMLLDKIVQTIDPEYKQMRKQKEGK